VEILTIKTHLLSECEYSNEYFECKKCQSAIEKVFARDHGSDPICRGIEFLKLALKTADTFRCPLCFQDFRGQEAFQNHFKKKPGCPEGRK
jgi:hypothetical protein